MEAYAFLAMFAAQILILSVLHPIWFVRYLQIKANPVEPAARQYVERRLAQYRALNAGIAAIGLLLLGWLFSYMRRPDWDDGPVEALAGAYFVVQMLPLCLVSWIVSRINKTLTQSLPKRRATLQRRGLFDFVSPFVFALAAVVYVLFAALVLYIAQAPFPGFAGPLVNIGAITALYALMAVGVYAILYHTKTNPLESHEDRMRAIGVGVRISIYACIGGVAAVSLNMMLILLDLQRWEPLGLSIFNVIFAIALAYSARRSLRRSSHGDDPQARATPC